MSRNSVAAGTASPAGSNTQILPLCSVTSIRPSCIWIRLVGSRNSRSVHNGSNRSVSRGGASVGDGAGGIAEVAVAGMTLVGVAVGVEIGDGDAPLVGDGSSRDAVASGAGESVGVAGAGVCAAGILWHPTTSARNRTARVLAVAVTSSRYYARSSVPSLRRRNVRIRIFKIWGLSGSKPFRDGALSILSNHKISQILILTIYGNG